MRTKGFLTILAVGVAIGGVARCTEAVRSIGSGGSRAPADTSPGGYVDIVVDPARSSCETHPSTRELWFFVALANSGTAGDSVTVMLWRRYDDGTVADGFADPHFRLDAAASTTKVYELHVPWTDVAHPPTTCAVMFEDQPGSTTIPVNRR